MLIQMRVQGLVFDPYRGAYILVLRDDESKETLPIWTGKMEANAVGLAMEGVTTPRPMTHDLLKNILDTLGAKMISIVINDLKEGTYFSKVHLVCQDSEFTVDARPSDAIALAIRANAPIFVAESVMKQQESESFDRWLENLKPEDFGQYET